MNTLWISSSMGIVFKTTHQYSTELLEGVGEGKEGAAQVPTTCQLWKGGVCEGGKKEREKKRLALEWQRNTLN